METADLIREVMYLSKDTQELASNMLRIDPSSDVVRGVGILLTIVRTAKYRNWSGVTGNDDE